MSAIGQYSTMTYFVCKMMNGTGEEMSMYVRLEKIDDSDQDKS
jgi:hypothetical protein